MKLLVIPLLVALFGQAGDDPVKLMKAMEDKIARADSIRVAFDAEIKSNKGDGTAKGSFVMAPGNKVRIEFSMTIMNNTFKLELVSDGVMMATALNGKVMNTENTPKSLRLRITAFLARSGITAGIAARIVRPNTGNDNPLDVILLSDFKKLKSEKVGGKDATVIDYKMTIKEEKAVISGKVWIDTQTNLPLQRVLHLEMGGEIVTITETYSNFRINPKIEGNPFELPK